MKPASKQLKADESKTISITEVRELRFKVLKPGKGIIEIVNKADHGRVCTLSINDFQSKADAEVYAELLKLAPELLNDYMNNAKKLEEVVDRLEKRVDRMKKRNSEIPKRKK